MDLIKFEQSAKNIPIHTKKTYHHSLINSFEKFVRNLRFKAFFFLNPDPPPQQKEFFGFKSIKPAPFVPELKPFEDDLIHLIQNVEFMPRTNQFLENLKQEKNEIEAQSKIFVPADKTTNMYLMEPKDYNSLLEKNVQKQYKKESEINVKKVEAGHCKIVKDLDIQDRVFATQKLRAFFTLKDHKSDFNSKPAVRIINPTKPEIGKISKKILERIVSQVKLITKLKQMKNTNSVLDWFKQMPNKKSKTFIQFDIESYYPSITPEILNKVLDWASTFVNITLKEREIIIKSKQSFLYTGDTPWVKKGDVNFDIGMGAWDGAESTDLVGLFMLWEMRNLQADTILYRDDGLIAADCTPQNVEKLKQDILKIFHTHGFKILIDANRKSVNFLDVTLNLENNSFKPYIKPGDSPLYVNSNSNHPPSIIKNIPAGINRRLSSISSSQQIFDRSAPLYQRELDRNGYNFTLKFDPPKKKKRCRSRRVLWFNPPYSLNVKTHVGAKFLKLIDKHFPPGSPLHSILNRNTVKVSYKCLPNLASILAKNNSKVMKSKETQAGGNVKCNCRNKAECPLPGKCLTPSLIYQAQVETTASKESYIGLTANTFKSRYSGHKSSFNKINRRNETTLSKHIWDLKEKNENYQITWKVISQAQPFSQVSGLCELCTREKFLIVFKPELATLNSRNELLGSCRHKRKKLLMNQTRKKKARNR